MAEDKFKAEFERLLKKHGNIMALLAILDADIGVRRELEILNEIPFLMRKSVDVEETRERLQKHLAETKQDIWGMVDILIKQAVSQAHDG